MEYEFCDLRLGNLQNFDLKKLNELAQNERLMKATKRLISSVWTLEYEITEEGKMRIQNYSRKDPEGYERESELQQCTLIETDDRIVVEVLLRPFEPFGWVNVENATQRYEVENPKHIFSYTP